jgi:DNA-binding MarR family transcriptional regulator
LDIKTYNKKPAICNCINLRRASQAITEVYNRFLASSGLNVNQYSLLKHIKHLEPVSVSDLALHVRLDRTTVVRNLKSMEKNGFVTDNSMKGTRNRQLELTDEGLKVLRKAEVDWLEAQKFIEEYLGNDAMNTLTSLLSKIEALVP